MTYLNYAPRIQSSINMYRTSMERLNRDFRRVIISKSTDLRHTKRNTTPLSPKSHVSMYKGLLTHNSLYSEFVELTLVTYRKCRVYDM